MARPRSDIRERIVVSARALFLSAGVEAASLRAICDDAGTSVGMIYYYFSTKEALFVAAIEEPLEVLTRDLEASLDPSLAVEERIERFHERLAVLDELESIAIRIVLREALVSAPTLDSLRPRIEPLYALLERTIEDGRACGSLRDDVPPSVLMLSLLGTSLVAPIVAALVPGAPGAVARGPRPANEIALRLGLIYLEGAHGYLRPTLGARST